MGQQSLPDAIVKPSRNFKSSPGQHLLSTFVVVTWSLFIFATIIVHELAVRSTWSHSRIVAGAAIPWAFRPETGLPSLLRTAFAQAHGPVTAMHLARLSVNALSATWASPRTWMELFWLADRRWADPFGLGTTGWTIASRRLRVSSSFCLFAALNIAALVTPVVMTRAYGVATGEIEYQVTIDTVSAVDLPKLRAVTNLSQIKTGNELWAKGVSPAELFPRNAFVDAGVQQSDTGGTWFFTGDSHTTEMSLYGIRVAGGCELLENTRSGSDAFNGNCKDHFGAGLNSASKLTQRDFFSKSHSEWTPWINSVSTCSNIGATTEFGKNQSVSSALFRLSKTAQYYPDDIIVRCNASAGLGTAVVNGLNMTFSQFGPTTMHWQIEDLTLFGWQTPLHPIAAVMVDDLLSLQYSARFKLAGVIARGGNESSFRPVLAAAMWDGVVAMTAAIWLNATSQGEHTGIQRLAATGLRRDGTFFCIMTTLLIVWLVGMFAATLALLRPTWTSSLDGYAVARILQYQPVVAGTPEVWFTELEQNCDMLEPFEMH